MPDLKKYHPAEVTAAWNGRDISEGIADGTFIEAIRDTRAYTLAKGPDGGQTRVGSKDKAGVIRITYRQGSSTHKLLTALQAADELSGTILGALVLKDNNGDSKAVGVNAFVDGPPNFARASTEGTITWTWVCPILKIVELGSADLNADWSAV